MKRYLILWLLMGFSYAGFSQEVTVTSAASDQPIELVTFSSQNPKVFTTTNADGRADISKFQGSELIEIRILGYKTRRMSYEKLKAEGFSIQLEPSNLSLGEVVVSANRWNQSSSKVPSKITSISSREVALQNPQTAADLLDVSGEVFVQKSQQGGGSPMIRGFATNRLLYTVDGVRMNTAIFRGGNIQNVISLDPFAVENTEVLFGSGSVIYGSDAIGGVMSFQTLSPQLSLTDDPLIKGNAVARYSSANNEKTGHFDVNIGWKKWALVTSFSSNDYGNLRMGTDGPSEYKLPYHVERISGIDQVVENEDPFVQNPSGYAQQNLMQKVRFRPNENWDFEYGFHYSETTEYGRFDRHLRTRNGRPRYAKWSYGPQKWMMNNLKITNSSSNVLYDEMTIRLAQQYFEESRIDRSFNDDEERNRIEQVDAYSANLDFAKSVGEKHQLYYGAEAVLNDVTSTAYNENIISGNRSAIGTRYPQSTWASYAAYLTDHYQVSEKVMLQAGVRYNHYVIESEFDTGFYDFPFTEANINNGSVTGNLGLVYRPTTSWVIKANASTAFRAPNVDDIGKVFDSEPGAVVVPNPDLEAEYAYSADLGIAKKFGDVVKVDVTAFYTLLDNALVRRDYTLDGQDSIMYDGIMSRVQSIQNAATANVYGVQAGIEIHLPAGFELSSDFNYQKGEEELDDGSTSASRHAAPWFGVSRLTYRANNLSLQLYSRYSGKIEYDELAVTEQGKPELYANDGNGNHYSPSWYTVNVKANYRLTENLSVSGGVENITDQLYRPYSSGIAAPGRNFILSLRANF
ncbi:TonB-dependent receptor [Salibacter halophilus]|uniref:TonB-dependent receptor plug domain-containing protein n=1 Tax=Salibacter halophilus TaxID=1803916 RepID=A0A6N6M749_9FLAO|nr:TonB-dependent receptor [Salibacter halophilus]KAB1063784.1 TonB-dependent receptor plug domain-containing protein [Salibacter halophilus]